MLALCKEEMDGPLCDMDVLKEASWSNDD